ncbi:hypothetical protein FSP39_020444 [Pinctada imbricata]|uniref:NACHT domain-containing protein n=1 Tax=Pinctada imbricata TaxID=66713 RepID=A0AA88XGF7_PINIB|nr:hypothetical protein FSP39_020444 [Pinctada imbricata]
MLVCVSLGVKQYELDQINYDASLDVRTKVFKGLLRWLEYRPEATEDDLIEELQQALNDNDRKDLADDIKNILEESKSKMNTNRGKQSSMSMSNKNKEIPYHPGTSPGSSVSVIQRWKRKHKGIAVKEFRETLYDMNYRETQRIPVSPLQRTSKMSMEEIFAPVSIREDLEYRGKGRNIGTQEKRTKPVICPDDMFLIDGSMAKNVFMLGDAAVGKSVFCLRLVENWCKANNPKSKNKSSSVWVAAFKKYDFLFVVQLRHVNKSRTSVIDMICNDVFHNHPECRDVICRVISDLKYRCLIVIDGLDEWKISDDAKQKLRIEGLPNVENIKNCTILWSMRPWVMEKISDFIRNDDRVVEIQGLDTESINILIENILVNFYELDKKSSEYKEKNREIKEKAEDSNLKSMMQIPLMAIACVQIWYEGKDVGKCLTGLYVALIDLLIRRANQKTALSSDIMNKLAEESSKLTHHLPQNITQNKNLKKIISVLLKHGKIAHGDLLTKETHLVFHIEDLEDSLEDYELDFALKTGLLSKCEAPGTFNEENVSVNFFHKSIQEFLAAIYIHNHIDIDDFNKHLSSVKVIMELGNVLIFLSGINPMLGSVISKHIVNVANDDTEVCRYRTFRDIKYRNDKVELLYKLQASCYREIIHSQTNTDNTQQVVPYHVSDVCVYDDSDIDTVRTTADILTHHHADIKSLCLIRVPTDGDNGIPNSILTQCLDHTVSLQSLQINGYNTIRTLYKISDRFSSLTALILFNITLTLDAISTLQTALQSNTVIQTLGLVDIKCQVNKGQGHVPASLRGLIQIIPDLPCLSTLYIDVNNAADKPLLRDVLNRLSHLHGIYYYDTSPRDAEYDRGVVQTLCTWSELRTLYLAGVSLGDSGLQLSHDMVHLDMVMLYKVSMSGAGWISFIQSAINVKHTFDTELDEVDIDERCIKMILTSPHMRTTHYNVNDDGSHDLYFTRVWPPSKTGQK